MEGIIHGDINGDGIDDILCNHWALVKGQGVTWLEHIRQAPWFVEHVVGTEGDIHGNGLGDINGDGRVDIVTPVGWYEQPKDGSVTPWVFHADYEFQPAKGKGGAGSHPILVYDVDGDGLNDIIIGSAHAYGFAWLQQKVDAAGKRTFITHWIETDYSQFHTMAMGDLNGDGKPDLVTGKRLFAHHGADIGAFEPLYTFWYDLKGGAFERHILSYNHLPYYPDEGGLNPPPNYVVSAGMKLNIVDLNKDGRNDIVIAGKGGLYVFYNQGKPPTPPHLHKLPPEGTYPTWRQWTEYQVLLNSKDFTGWKVPAGDNGHWKVVDGVIECDGSPNAKGDEVLWTADSFEDFCLHIEWRFDQATGPEAMAVTPALSPGLGREGTEVLIPSMSSYVLFRGAGPSEQGENSLGLLTVKPIGQWNSCDITVVGNRVTILFNDKALLENVQIPLLAASGPIGLRHDGGLDQQTGQFRPPTSVVQFRNILIRKLSRKGG
jgi:hypothetical protein